MKIGISSFAFRWHLSEGMKPEGLLKKARELGAQCVQLCENAKLELMSEEELREVKNRAAESGLVLETGVKGGDRETLSGGIKTASSLGARVLRAVVDAGDDSPCKVAATIRSLVPALRENRICLCLENHFRFTPAEIAWIVGVCSAPEVAVCLDPLNSIALMIGPEETLRTLGPLAKTAHIKDASIVRLGTGFALSGRPLGEGDVDLPGYMEKLRGKVDSLLLESWLDGSPSTEDTLERELHWVKTGLDYMRRHL